MATPKKIIIIGAGHAGLLAANLLRRHDVEVWEGSPKLPDNHAAILRFRSPAVSDALGVPFSKVKVFKGAWDGEKVRNQVTIPMANAYSLRVCGEVHQRSIWNLEPETRWLAPGEFTQYLARGCSIELDSPANHSNLTNNPGITFISTVPMPVLMSMLGYSLPDFKSESITVFRFTVPGLVSSVVQTVYNCQQKGYGPEWYRVTLEGNILIVEFTGVKETPLLCEQLALAILRDVFGVVTDFQPELIQGKVQPYGKLLPIDETLRRNFIHWATTNFHIYSLGRFATWRPGLLMDDLVKDIKVIDRLMESGDAYAHQIQTQK